MLAYLARRPHQRRRPSTTRRSSPTRSRRCCAGRRRCRAWCGSPRRPPRSAAAPLRRAGWSPPCSDQQHRRAGVSRRGHHRLRPGRTTTSRSAAACAGTSFAPGGWSCGWRWRMAPRQVPYALPDGIELLYSQACGRWTTSSWCGDRGDRPSAAERRLLIDGELTEAAGGATFENVNPATEVVLGVVADGTGPTWSGPWPPPAGPSTPPPGPPTASCGPDASASSGRPRGRARGVPLRSWWPRWAARCSPPTAPSSTRRSPRPCAGPPR